MTETAHTPNPLTLEAFAGWCESKPADEEYDYESNENCAIAQYFRHVGMPATSIGGFTWCDVDGNYHELPRGFDDPAGAAPYTFGALASGLRAR